jgi:hypothetical protein
MEIPKFITIGKTKKRSVQPEYINYLMENKVQTKFLIQFTDGSEIYNTQDIQEVTKLRINYLNIFSVFLERYRNKMSEIQENLFKNVLEEKKIDENEEDSYYKFLGIGTGVGDERKIYISRDGKRFIIFEENSMYFQEKIGNYKLFLFLGYSPNVPGVVEISVKMQKIDLNNNVLNLLSLDFFRNNKFVNVISKNLNRKDLFHYSLYLSKIGFRKNPNISLENNNDSFTKYKKILDFYRKEQINLLG